MKSNRFSSLYKTIVLVSVFTIFGVSTAFAASYVVDPVHTSIIFRIKHLGVAYTFGRFNGATGTFSFNEAGPSVGDIKMQVSTGDIDTNDDKRDNHLRSPDFFDAAKYPLIQFKSTSAKTVDKEHLEVSGDITIHGHTRPITVTVRHTGSGKDPWGAYRSGFESTFTLKRSDFGMNFMLGGIGDVVNLTVSVEGIKQ